MAAKLKDLLKCKNKVDIERFAQKNNLEVKKVGSNLQIGEWSCIMNGDKFLYVR